MSITITHPNWCTDHIQEADGTLLTHRHECGFETEDGDQVLVTVLDDNIPSRYAPAGTYIDLYALAERLSSTDARRAAAALLIAADHADGREPELWLDLVIWWLNAKNRQTGEIGGAE